MQHSKLADWDDDDPQAIQDTSSRWDKVVILKHMFTLQELEVRITARPSRIPVHSMLTMTLQEDPAAILDIKEDIREECAKMGPVTNVVLFDKEPSGVASVRYSNVEAAEACVKVCSDLQASSICQFKDILPRQLAHYARVCFPCCVHNEVSYKNSCN